MSRPRAASQLDFVPLIIPGTNFYSASSPKLYVKRSRIKGRCVYTTESIQIGEFVASIGGQAISLSAAMALPILQRKKCLQIDDDLVLWSANHREGIADWINHSCNPNIGVVGYTTFVAIRNINPGEEISYDYCTVEADHLDEFACHCGDRNCRKFISGSDWKNQQLQERYAAHFSNFIKRKLSFLETLELRF